MTGYEGGIGLGVGIAVKFLWDKFNGDYITKKDFHKYCSTCNEKSVKELVVVRKIVLKLANKAGLDVKEYEDLAE